MDPHTPHTAHDARPVRSWKRRVAMTLGGVAAIAACVVIRFYDPPQPASAQAPRANGPTSPAGSRPAAAAGANGAARGQAPGHESVVAVVNGEEISRNDLARQCLVHYGDEVLDSLINYHLVQQECKKRNLAVTKQEVDEEIDRVAKRFGVSTAQWLKMLANERGIQPAQYAKDIIWPTLALSRLADERVKVTEQDVRDAYEANFGASVKARLIACTSAEAAQQVWQLARQNPEEFGNLAKEHSVDINSASAKGLIQPIRRHVGDKELERVAFELRPGEISPVIQVGDQFVILKCEELLPPTPMPMEQVREQLIEAIREKKRWRSANEVLRDLQAESTIDNFYSDPARRDQAPGIAARINDQTVTMVQLADACVERHGAEVLEGLVSRRILEQACRRYNVTVAKADLDDEIDRAAMAMGRRLGPDQPDRAGWLTQVTEELGIPVDLYVQDTVWPTVALKKLVGAKVEVTEDDLQKGFEANYGPRVRCRAIVLDHQRRAQEVWEMARSNPTSEYFARLAEQYSIEAASRQLGGEVPPIQRHGGRPLLEEEAFSLQPGELSGVLQVGDKFVILLCEGHTQPVNVSAEEVRALLYDDIYEKKLRLSMAEMFDQLKDSAHIDNRLVGTLQTPKPQRPAGQPVNLDPNVRPAGGPPARTGANSPAGGLPR